MHLTFPTSLGRKRYRVASNETQHAEAGRAPSWMKTTHDFVGSFRGEPRPRARLEEVRFALDSALEESGFEPLVPLNLRRRRFSEHLFGLPPGCTAPEDGPAENGMRVTNGSIDCLSMRRSADIAISSSRSPACSRLPLRSVFRTAAKGGQGGDLYRRLFSRLKTCSSTCGARVSND